MQELAMSRGQTGRADFDALIGPHLDAAYRTALAILRDPDAAHDAVQDASLKAWRKLNQLHERKPARPWFLAIVANQCRSERRRHWWSVIRMPEVETDAKQDEVSAESVDIDRALARLPRAGAWMARIKKLFAHIANHFLLLAKIFRDKSFESR